MISTNPTDSPQEELDNILESLHNSWFEDDYDPTDPDALGAKAAILDWHSRQQEAVLQKLSLEMGEAVHDFNKSAENMTKPGSKAKGLASGLKSTGFGWFQAKRLVDEELATLRSKGGGSHER